MSIIVLIQSHLKVVNDFICKNPGVTPWSLYLVFLLYVWVGQGVTWVYMLYFVLGFVLIGSVYY